jgi:hypothetical protein
LSAGGVVAVVLALLFVVRPEACGRAHEQRAREAIHQPGCCDTHFPRRCDTPIREAETLRRELDAPPPLGRRVAHFVLGTDLEAQRRALREEIDEAFHSCSPILEDRLRLNRWSPKLLAGWLRGPEPRRSAALQIAKYELEYGKWSGWDEFPLIYDAMVPLEPDALWVVARHWAQRDGRKDKAPTTPRELREMIDRDARPMAECLVRGCLDVGWARVLMPLSEGGYAGLPAAVAEAFYGEPLGSHMSAKRDLVARSIAVSRDHAHEVRAYLKSLTGDARGIYGPSLDYIAAMLAPDLATKCADLEELTKLQQHYLLRNLPDQYRPPFRIPGWAKQERERLGCP